jgi:nitrate reductase NapE
MAQSSTLNHYQLKTSGRYHKVTQDQQEKADERTTFLFLAVVLAPVSAIAIVGGYGFAVWISQMIVGPPGSVF